MLHNLIRAILYIYTVNNNFQSVFKSVGDTQQYCCIGLGVTIYYYASQVVHVNNNDIVGFQHNDRIGVTVILVVTHHST